MTGPPRDWDKEMAEIDKIIAKGGTAPPSGAVVKSSGGGAPAAGGAPAPVARSRRTLLTAWIRVGLGVAVAVGVTQWPYAHPCGMALYLYIGAAGGVVLAGLWGAVTSWARRMGWAHLLSLLVTMWGALLVGKAVVDRSSYVKHPAVWTCP